MMPKKPYKEKTHRTARPTIRLSDETMQEMDNQILATGAKSRADYITALVHNAKGRINRMSDVIQKIFCR